MKSVAVFCGSSSGYDTLYTSSAYQLGGFLAENDMKLIFGGGQVGLMGAVSNGCLEKKGYVIGVIPHFLNLKEIAHSGVSELISVDSMHERKSRIYEISDGFIILPGGFGTCDEMFEILTWGQLGLHGKPIGILNIKGYFDSMLDYFNTMVNEGFLKAENRDAIIVSEDIEELCEKMEGELTAFCLKFQIAEDSFIILREIHVA